MIKKILAAGGLGFAGYVAYLHFVKNDDLGFSANVEGGGFIDTALMATNEVKNLFENNNLGLQAMTPSLRLLNFLKEYESKRLAPYFATDYERKIGKQTIGYGHVILPNENFGKGITDAQAEKLFVDDVNKYSEPIYKYVKVDLSQNQFDALVSFVFNIGETNFRKSTLLKKLNAGDYDEAANQFMRWAFQDGKPIAGLYNRRYSEVRIFKHGIYAKWNG